jgi:hypothetical protein
MNTLKYTMSGRRSGRVRKTRTFYDASSGGAVTASAPKRRVVRKSDKAPKRKVSKAPRRTGGKVAAMMKKASSKAAPRRRSSGGGKPVKVGKTPDGCHTLYKTAEGKRFYVKNVRTGTKRVPKGCQTFRQPNYTSKRVYV